MKPRILNVAASGESTWVALDHHVNPFNVRVAVVSVSASESAAVVSIYHLQMTMADVLAEASVSSSRVTELCVVQSAAGTAVNITYPITAVRVLVSALGTGQSFDLVTLQAGH